MFLQTSTFAGNVFLGRKKKLCVEKQIQITAHLPNTPIIRLSFLLNREEANHCEAGRRAPCAYLHHYVLPPLHQKDLENSYLWPSTRVPHPSQLKGALRIHCVLLSCFHHTKSSLRPPPPQKKIAPMFLILSLLHSLTLQTIPGHTE